MNQLLKDLFLAYFEARRNKRNTLNQLCFELEYEKNIYVLYEEIMSRNYKPRPSIAFIIDKPIKREIFAADFRDRVVHHLIYIYINPIIEKKLIYDTYSCRKGKGTLFGIKRAESFMRGVTNHYQDNAWVLKLDISGYFMNMNRQLLYDKLLHMLSRGLSQMPAKKQDTLLFLLEKNVFNDPSVNCRVKGSKSDWKGLPRNKSLFYSPPDCGLPIGNLTSQVYGNVYLDSFDHYVKRHLKIRYYCRYVDDLLFFHVDREYLKFCMHSLSRELKERHRLEVHPKKIYLQPCNHGVQFLGQFILPWRCYLGRRAKGNFYLGIKQLNQQWEDNPLTPRLIDKTICRVNSWLGICRHANTYKLRFKILARLSARACRFLDVDSKIHAVRKKGEITCFLVFLMTVCEAGIKVLSSPCKRGMTGEQRRDKNDAKRDFMGWFGSNNVRTCSYLGFRRFTGKASCTGASIYCSYRGCI